MQKMQILEKRYSIISPETSWQEMGATIKTSKKVWVEDEIFINEEECQKQLEEFMKQYKTMQYEISCVEPKLNVYWKVIEEKEI